MIRAMALAGGLGLALTALPAPAAVVVAKGGLVRVLDRMTGQVADYDLGPGQVQAEGRLTVRLDECRYPSDQPQAEAYAHLTITDAGQVDPIFKGWMVASSPALSALDHPRYDVWVLHCDVPGAAPPPAPASVPPPAASTKPASGSGG